MSEIIEAVKRGDLATVRDLLDAEPELLEASENGVSAIMLALYHGKPEVAPLFLERGRKLTFHEACAMGDAAQVKQLLEADPSLLNSRSPDGFPAVGLPIFFRQPETARYLIEKGADVNAAAENPTRVAPVHAAAAVRDRETLRMLLERGADANAKQQRDYTPLHTAASRGDIAMAQLLLSFGADPKAVGSDGQSPADVAASHDQPAFAEWISTVT